MFAALSAKKAPPPLARESANPVAAVYDRRIGSRVVAAALPAANRSLYVAAVTVSNGTIAKRSFPSSS